MVSKTVLVWLALTLFGIGLSAFVGKPFESVSLLKETPLEIPLLAQIPLLGPVLFRQHVLVYVSWALFAGVSWFLLLLDDIERLDPLSGHVDDAGWRIAEFDEGSSETLADGIVADVSTSGGSGSAFVIGLRFRRCRW